MDDLEEGKSHELAVTTAWGLYRYRLGDVVKVVGFYSDPADISDQPADRKGAPLIEFGHRLGQLLNVRGEKTSERAVVEALGKSVERWRDAPGGLGATLVDYCCVDPVLIPSSIAPSAGAAAASGASSLPHYDLFVELEDDVATEDDDELWERRAEIVDEELCRSNPVYKSFR